MEIPKSTTALLLNLLIVSTSLLSSSTAASHRKLATSLAPSPSTTTTLEITPELPTRFILSNLAAAPPKLSQICQKTDNPEVCIKTVAPFLKGSVDIVSVLKAQIEAMSRGFEGGINYINSVRSTAPGGVDDCLSTCVESFQMGISDAAEALDAIEARDIGKLNTVLSACVTYSTTCEDEFATLKLESPVAMIDGVLDKLGGNALAISNLLDWEQMNY